MEPWNSPDFENQSPSQGNIAHSQPIKRDGESLEDFEDITKDEPSVKDMTELFLKFETNPQKASVPEDNLSYYPTKGSDYVHISSSSDELNKALGNSDLEERTPSPKVSNENSFNNFPNVEQTNALSKNNDMLDLKDKSILNVVDENKLTDVVSNDEISTGSDDLSFIPTKGESSPLLHADKDISKNPPFECKSSEKTDSPFNLQPLSKFTSEPGINREQELEILQGDGLHVRNTVEDLSENDDEFIPEPIPKDYPEIGAIEGMEFLAAIGLDTWFHPHFLHPKVESLIYWRDPKKSGIVFGSILIILLSLTSFSLISVVAYTSLIALASALAFRIYKSVMQAVQKTSEGHPFKQFLVGILNHPFITTVFNIIEEYLDIDLTVNPDKAREISEVAVTYLNKGLMEGRRLFLIEDVIDSIKFGVILWVSTYIGAWFNGLSLLIIAFVGLFTLPKVYENNKAQIDANIDIVKTKINEVTEKITALIPMGKKTEEAKAKGE